MTKIFKLFQIKEEQPFQSMTKILKLFQREEEARSAEWLRAPAPCVRVSSNHEFVEKLFEKINLYHFHHYQSGCGWYVGVWGNIFRKKNNSSPLS